MRREWFLPVGLLLLVTAAPCRGQKGPDEQPGVIRLHNGLVLGGLCSLTNTTDPLLQNQKLELRRIDQGYRDYLVSTRQSAKVIPDATAVPNQKFDILQRRTGQRAMNFSIGLHQYRPFGPDGTSRVTLMLQAGRKVDIDTGIVSVNSQFAVVQGLTHKWTYGVSMETIPDAVLYAGANQPGLLTKVRNFADGETQLNLVQLLLDAEKYAAARQLLSDIPNSFPDLAARCERSVERWNDQVGSRVIAELTRLYETGRYQAARRYARRWPDGQLDPVIRVRAKQFLEGTEADVRRLNTIRESLSDAVGQIVAEDMRRTATQMWQELKTELDLNLLPRLAPYELLGQGDGMAPESRFAFAATGWLLGAENATDGFPDAAGLMQIRYLVLDYLQTRDEEQALRNELLQKIRSHEGFSPERVAAIIRNLPPDRPLTSGRVTNEAADFVLDDDDLPVRVIGRLPAEYSTTRRYPLVLAFPQEGVTAEETRNWWMSHTDRHGCILAIPELYDAGEGSYESFVRQHRQFLSVLLKLKTGFSVDDDRVFLVGHGIGAEAALDIGTAHPDLFAGIASVAGLGRRHLQWTAHNSTQLPWYLVVGTRQPFYYQRMELLLRKLFQRVAVRGRLEFCNVVLVRYAERGFEPYAEEATDLFRWMDLQRRPALPERINAVTLKSTDRSWFWLELDEIPERFVSMDDPNSFDDRPASSGTVSASVSGNLIRINQLPSSGAIRLSPGMPEIDLTQPISLRMGAKTEKFDYKPSTRDMLEDFRLRRDRLRLCYMKVLVRK